MIRQVVFTLLLGSSLAASGQAPKSAPPPPADIPFARLTADATVAVALGTGSIEAADGIWIANRAAGTIVRIDAKDNTAGTPVPAGAEPCGSLVAAFDSVWVPLCGDGTLARVDPKTAKVTAALKLAMASGDGRIATGVGSIWAITDPKGVVSRIDPGDQCGGRRGLRRPRRAHRGLRRRGVVGHERGRQPSSRGSTRTTTRSSRPSR